MPSEHSNNFLVSFELTQIVSAFGHYVDARDNDRVIELFAPDCEVKRPGGSFLGHEGLRQMLEARPSDVQTLHVFSDFLFDFESAISPTCDYHFLLFNGVESSDDYSLPSSLPSLCGTITDRFVKIDGEWRIKFRDALVVFSDV